MDNTHQPISKVSAFAIQAQTLGCYSKNKRYNFETAWAVLQKALPTEGLSPQSTVEEVLPKVDDLLDHHGRQSSASASSIRAYKARIKTLLTDFVRHNGGDFMAWKKELEKSSTNGDTKPRRNRKAPRTRITPSGSEGGVDTITQILFVGEGKEGKIVIPRALTAEEIDQIWAQLEAIKMLVKAQNRIDESKSK
jgi:hypothetical protein